MMTNSSPRATYSKAGLIMSTPATLAVAETTKDYGQCLHFTLESEYFIFVEIDKVITHFGGSLQ